MSINYLIMTFRQMSFPTAWADGQAHIGILVITKLAFIRAMIAGNDRTGICFLFGRDVLLGTR